MKFSKSVVLPERPELVWPKVTDLGVLADCLPGARLTSVDNGNARGSLAVRVGRVLADFEGVARVVRQDDDTRSIVVEAEGSGSQGRAEASISAHVTSEESGSRLDLVVEVEIAGGLARLGRGMAEPVVERLIELFAVNMGERLSPPSVPKAATRATQGAPASSAEFDDVFDLSSTILESRTVRLGLVVLASIAALFVLRRLMVRPSPPTPVIHVHLSSPR